jgi:hypothetical protein
MGESAVHCHVGPQNRKIPPRRGSDRQIQMFRKVIPQREEISRSWRATKPKLHDSDRAKAADRMV